MDLIDKAMVFALGENGRISFQALARKLKLSVTSVKKRFDRLVEKKVILRFELFPSLAMMDTEYYWAFLTTAESSPNEALCDWLGANPMVGPGLTVLSDGDVQCWGMYRGSQGLDDLVHFLHEHPSVIDVEFHTLLVDRGMKRELKPAHVEVLNCLKQDLRMQIKEMARRTGFSPRRVRRLLDELLVRGGTANPWFAHEKGVGDARSRQACFYASVDLDVSATGFTRFLVRIEYSGGVEARWNLVRWLKRRYPTEIYSIIVSASDTVLFSVFLVEYMSQTIDLIKVIENAPGVVSVKQIIFYQHRFYPGLYERFWKQLFSSI